MLHGNQAGVYRYLRAIYLKNHVCMDEYRGQNLLSRRATIYAVKNTVIAWREEQKKRRHTDG